MASHFLQSIMVPEAKEQLDQRMAREIELTLQEEDNYCALEEMGLDEEYDTNKTIHEVLQEARSERKGGRRS